MTAPIVETAKILPKGQITIPIEIRRNLGLETGDRVMMVWDGQKAVMINPAVYALQWLGDLVAGDAEQAGFVDEDAVASFVTDLRREKRAK
ncbi:MAG: AbrB/MazE/SpoVT family DNA-binding domain-containing protein [Micrococcales bacterium]|nr:AbrB/MazE/SpoVT family DNA-binding domain-containing protein [Micrococcales bacterium]